MNHQTEYSLERVRQVNEILEAGEQLVARIRRIGSYLGQGWKPPCRTALGAAGQIRANIQNGDNDEAIALFLEAWRKPDKKRGRPSGSLDLNGLALRALELHNSDPKQWTWAKVADELCEHRKRHAPHALNSTCTASLKQSVQRLREFLHELQSTKATRSP